MKNFSSATSLAHLGLLAAVCVAVLAHAAPLASSASELPAIKAPPPDSDTALPAGWGFWTDNRDKTQAEFCADPVPHIALRAGHQGQWSLALGGTEEVKPGEKWTFTAVCAGRNLGLFGAGGGALTIRSYNTAGELANPLQGANWQRGTFSWQILSVTVAVPEGIARLRPRFYGHGGGEFFIASAAFEKSDQPADLAVPEADCPQYDEPLQLAVTVVPDRKHCIYDPGETIAWPIPNINANVNLNYRVVGPYDELYAEGTAAPGRQVSFDPPDVGYYELRLTGEVNPAMRIESRSSAIVAPLPPRTAPFSNPFGAQSGPLEINSRLAMTWARWVAYNIVSGSHSELPTDLATYADAWEERMHQEFNPYYATYAEVWNEPLNEIKPGWKMQDFAGMVRATREGIHRVDPSFKVAVDFTHLYAYQSFHKAGGAGLYDVMTLHPYSHAIFANPGWPERPEHAMLAEEIISARELLNRAGLEDVEIWTTEYGWPTAQGHPFSTTELDQARFNVRSSLLQLAAGVKRVCPFRMTDVSFWGPRDGTFGFIRTDGTPKPCLLAYGVMAMTINDLPYAGYFRLGHNVGAFAYGREKETVLALWHPDEEQEIDLALPRAANSVITLFGQKTRIAGHRFMGTIGPSPIYIVTHASPEQLAEAIGSPLRTGPPKGLFDYGRPHKHWQIPAIPTPPQIDADLSEWSGPEIVLADPQQRWEGRARLAVDGENLYVALAVGGNTPGTNNEVPSKIWAGNCLEVFISTRPESRTVHVYLDSDYQIGLSPGNQGDGALAADIIRTKEVIAGAKVAARALAGGGWELETAIPLSFFGGPDSFAPGREIGLDLKLDVGSGDKRQAEPVWNAGGAVWANPYLWGTATVVSR